MSVRAYAADLRKSLKYGNLKPVLEGEERLFEHYTYAQIERAYPKMGGRLQHKNTLVQVTSKLESMLSKVA